MLAAPCTNCGRPCPLSLAEPGRLSCAACGRSGEAPPEVSSALRSAAAILEREAVELRQFGDRTRRALGKAGKKVLASTLFAWAMFLLPAGFALIGGVLLLGQEKPSFSMFLFVLVPAVSALFVTWLATREARAARSALELAAAAVPPLSSGGPARCRVCGAPLKAGDGAVARCGYCQADNAVGPELLKRASEKKAAARTDIETAVREAAMDVNRAARRAALASLAASLGSPVVSVAAIVVVGLALAAIPTAERTDLQYALIQGPSGPCFALVSQYRDHVRISYGGSSVLKFEDRSSTDGLNLVRASFLLGRKVQSPDRPQISGTVVRVHGALNGSNVAVVRTGEGQEVDLPPEGLCLVPGQVVGGGKPE